MRLGTFREVKLFNWDQKKAAVFFQKQRTLRPLPMGLHAKYGLAGKVGGRGRGMGGWCKRNNQYLMFCLRSRRRRVYFFIWINCRAPRNIQIWDQAIMGERILHYVEETGMLILGENEQCHDRAWGIYTHRKFWDQLFLFHWTICISGFN